MDEFARSLIKSAVIREQAVQKLYKDLALKTNNKDLKKIFTKLSEEEEIHEQLFSKLDINTLKKVNSSELGKIDLNLPNNNTIDFKEKRDINSVIDFAIEEENKAIKDYSNIEIHLPFSPAKETLKEMNIQEKRHKNLLEKIKLEFNDNDWSMIK